MSTIITELPLYTDLDYVYGTNLEGESKQIRIYWNERSGQWHMDIRNEDQTPVILGVPLVINYPMLVDHPLQSYGLTGYFLLLPNTIVSTPDVTSTSSVLPQYYTFMYVYLTD